MNGYGSESDARDSFCDHHSDNFSCSDNESFNMDSVSQVNLMEACQFRYFVENGVSEFQLNFIGSGKLSGYYYFVSKEH